MKSNLFKVRVTQLYPKILISENENLLKIKYTGILPPVHMVRATQLAPAIPIGENLFKIKFNQILPPIHRVRVSLSIVDVDRIFEHLLSIRSNIALHSSKPLSEAFFIQEILVSHATKNFNNKADINDNKILNYTKGQHDVGLLDEDLRFIYDKFIQEISETASNILISFDTPKDDITNLYDDKFIHVLKALTDSFVNDDTVKADFIKYLETLSSIRDDITFNTDKRLALISNIQDLQFLINSFIRSFNEETIPNENFELNFSKGGLEENIDFSDTNTIDYNKFRDSILNTLSTFYRIVQYQRQFLDNTDISELNTLHLNKPITFDSVGLEDVIIVSFVVSRLFEEFTYISTNTSFNTNKFNTNLVESNDLLSRIVQYSREFQDKGLVNEDLFTNFIKSLQITATILTDIAFEIIKSNNDTILTNESVVFDHAKVLTDVFETTEDTNMFDGSLYMFIKGLSLISNIEDAITVLVEFIRQHNDLVSINDVISSSVAKILSDNSNAIDNIAKNLSRLLNISVTPDSLISTHPTKKFNNATSISDDSIEFVMIYVKNNTIDLNDQISAKSVNKIVTDNSNSIDDVTKSIIRPLISLSQISSILTISQFKSLNNVSQIADNIRMLNNLSVSNITTINDNDTININNIRANLISSVDSGNLLHQTYGGVQYFAEDYTGDITTF
jgi:hypothetical protein